MFNSVNNKLIVLSNGKPNQKTPLMLINNEINGKISQKRKKRVRHEVLSEKNKRKSLKDSVSYWLN
jgi:hypothetical protein